MPEPNIESVVAAKALVRELISKEVLVLFMAGPTNLWKGG